jgi:hypothetical protein
VRRLLCFCDRLCCVSDGYYRSFSAQVHGQIELRTHVRPLVPSPRDIEWCEHVTIGALTTERGMCCGMLASCMLTDS